MRRPKKYYVCGHTGKGFINLLDKNLQQIKNVFLLQGFPPLLRTKIIKETAEYFKQKQKEYILNPDIINNYDGLIIRDMSLAVLHKDLYSQKNGAKKITVLSESTISQKRLRKLEQKKTSIYQTAYKHFANGFAIHQLLEEVYISQMDFQKADIIAEQLIEKIFAQRFPVKKSELKYERLFLTNTPYGTLNYAGAIIEGMEHIYLIRGRAGTGKSFLLNKMIKCSKERGFFVEIFRCSLDPNSIDMVLIPELKTCLIDDTPPHQLSNVKIKSSIIDMYKETVKKGTDEKFHPVINKYNEKYKKEMKRGLIILEQIRQLEGSYKSLLNNIDVERLVYKYVKEITKNK